MIIHSIEDSFSFALADLLTLDTEINEATYSALRGRASSAISKKNSKEQIQLLGQCYLVNIIIEFIDQSNFGLG